MPVLNERDLVLRIKNAAAAAGVGVVPPKQSHLFRLRKTTLEILGWTPEEEALGNVEVRAMLAMIKNPNDTAAFQQALMVGNISQIRGLAEQIDGPSWRPGAESGFFGLVDDYLAEQQGISLGGLSPREAGGIY